MSAADRRPHGDNVVPFPRRRRSQPVGEAVAFKQLTRQLILQRAREGRLEVALVEYFLDGIGLRR
jgi:hypothetical protein